MQEAVKQTSHQWKLKIQMAELKTKQELLKRKNGSIGT